MRVSIFGDGHKPPAVGNFVMYPTSHRSGEQGIIPQGLFCGLANVLQSYHRLRSHGKTPCGAATALRKLFAFASVMLSSYRSSTVHLFTMDQLAFRCGSASRSFLNAS